ncbi:hypothetical protein PAHAL_2G145600 [Panicum hallii]|jgi:hypothetical protein|uniref:Uncharacterized protein n=1 Tax=Panicum hallii TaxID=206008 RepID=A0A2T8KP42_9POAL|nr:hypothetical protein PAHAL_2G145600 [Panicum hallii]
MQKQTDLIQRLSLPSKLTILHFPVWALPPTSSNSLTCCFPAARALSQAGPARAQRGSLGGGATSTARTTSSTRATRMPSSRSSSAAPARAARSTPGGGEDDFFGQFNLMPTRKVRDENTNILISLNLVMSS